MPSSTSIIKTQNVFLHLPKAHSDCTLLNVAFFITGNPGLISYYHKFLGLLCQDDTTASYIANHGDPSSSNSGTDRYALAGFSLGGFDQQIAKSDKQLLSQCSGDSKASATRGTNENNLFDEDNLADLMYPPGFEWKQIYSLRDQIELCYARLTTLVARLSKQRTTTGLDGSSETDSAEEDRGQQGRRWPKVNVILMGHSVGAYIALEMQRLHYNYTRSRTAASSSDSRENSASNPPFTITTTILLTPTVLDIAQSPSGRVATPLLTYLPFLPGLAQLGSSALTSVLPGSTLKWVVGKATGMGQGSEALDATVAFLGSAGAVRQALCLAGDEMREIDGREWGDEVWGVLEDVDKVGEVVNESGRGGSGKWTAPKLYFWFAREDHWVADVTREEIVRMAREKFGDECAGDGRKTVDAGRRPVVVVDQDDGLVHAWCIAQSELVAKRVRMWLQEAMADHFCG